MWKSAKIQRSGIRLAAAGYAVCIAVSPVYAHSQARVRAADAIQISTCEQLQAIDQNLSGNYVLTTDIDCSATSNWNNGVGFVPIGLTKNSAPFTGTLDGQGHTISGLTINLGGTSHDAGLFFIIKNTTVQSIHFTGSSVTGHANAGTLAAAAVDSNLSGIRVDDGTVTAADESSSTTGGLVSYFLNTSGGHAMSDSYFSGTVSGHANTGGLVGRASAIGVRTSSSAGTVSGTASVGGLIGQTIDGAALLADYSHANVSAGGDNAGGLVGLHGDDAHAAPSIESSYASGSVHSTASNAGGLVGTMRGDIRYSFAAGAVSAPNTDSTGGLIGHYGSGTTANNAYDQARTGQPSCIGGGSCTGITAINTSDAPNAGYFFGSLANSPLSHWDSGVWSPVATDFPVLGSHAAPSTSQGSTHPPGKPAAPKPGATPPAPPPPAPGTTPATITIGYRGDFLQAGRAVSNLHTGDVVQFSVTQKGAREGHSATIKEVGKDYVVFTIASTPFDVRVDAGKTKDISVHQDRHMDVRIKLGKIKDGATTATFRALGATHVKATAIPAATVNHQGQPLAWTGAVALIIVCGTISTVIRVKRVRAAQAESQDQAELVIAALVGAPKPKKERRSGSGRKRQAAEPDNAEPADSIEPNNKD